MCNLDTEWVFPEPSDITKTTDPETTGPKTTEELI